jgi:hypothetical protein
LYPREFLFKLADELAVMPEGTATLEAIADYVVLREQIRICRGTSPFANAPQ